MASEQGREKELAVSSGQLVAEPPSEPLAWLGIRTRESHTTSRREFVRRSLMAADVIGLSIAFFVSTSVFGLSASGDHARPVFELAVFFVSLPLWMLISSVNGLYAHDEWRMLHSTVDDFFGVIQTVTLGAWLFFMGCWISGISYPRPAKLIAFWFLATFFVTASRVVARTWCRRSSS